MKCFVLSSLTAAILAIGFYSGVACAGDSDMGQPSANYVWVTECPNEDVSYLARKDPTHKEMVEKVETYKELNGYWHTPVEGEDNRCHTCHDPSEY